MRKLSSLIVLGFFLVLPLACNLTGALNSASPTPAIMADTFFSGHAFIDANGNGALDADDPPLEGARFTCAGFGARTGADGVAVVVIPGEWDKPVEARMAPPEGSGYTLIAANGCHSAKPGADPRGFPFHQASQHSHQSDNRHRNAIFTSDRSDLLHHHTGCEADDGPLPTQENDQSCAGGALRARGWVDWR